MTEHAEIGCYGDGTFGHQHTREACSDVLGYFYDENFRSRGLHVPSLGDWTPYDLLMALRAEMTDDASEELAACEWLNEHVPFKGATWGWQDGDFGLWPESEDA